MVPRSSPELPDQNTSIVYRHCESEGEDVTNDNNADANNVDSGNSNNNQSKSTFPPKAPVNNVIKRVSFSTSPNEHYMDTPVNDEITLMTTTSEITEDGDDEYDECDDDDDDDEEEEDEDEDEDEDEVNNNINTSSIIEYTSLNPTKNERKRKIRWSGHVRVQEVRHLSNISEYEKEAVWMSAIDYKMIKSMAKSTVFMIMSGEHIGDDDPDFCIRGLECRTRAGSKLRNANKMRNRSAVLNEQDLQLEEGFYDPQFIAMASMDESFDCKEEGKKRAEHDTVCIRSYIDDIPRVWGTGWCIQS